MNEKISILIVDDDIGICKTMSFILERKGYAVATAKDGLEAIEMVKEKSFDIIFMDIKMPIMDGVEAYKRIKKIRLKTIVIMMTAYAVEDLVEEALQEGAYRILYKPLDMEEVVVVIKEAREEKRASLILVVDDDEGTCSTMKKILGKKGYMVGIAHTGEEAIALAEKNLYDIIFIDMKLPTINGLETYLAIKEINKKAVVIMITAFRQEMAELVKAALEGSAYTCLYKPLDMENVLTLVDEILKKR